MQQLFRLLILIEQGRNRSFLVDTRDCLGEHRCNRQNVDLIQLLVVGQRDGIEDGQLLDRAVLDALDRRSGQYAVACTGVNLSRAAALYQSVRCVYERACGVDQVVNQNALLALYVADDVHNLGYVGLRTALVDDGKRHIQLLGELAGTGNRTQIGRNDNGIIGADAELARNVRDQNGRTEHVIHRNVKEALDLRSVQVHGQHAVSACSSNEVCDQLCGDRVTRLALAVLTSVAEIRDYSRDTACRCTLAGVDHDEH